GDGNIVPVAVEGNSNPGGVDGERATGLADCAARSLLAAACGAESLGSQYLRRMPERTARMPCTKQGEYRGRHRPPAAPASSPSSVPRCEPVRPPPAAGRNTSHAFR